MLLPHEPVKLQYIHKSSTGVVWRFDKLDYEQLSTIEGCKRWCPLQVFLANGQRIIVRAKQ